MKTLYIESGSDTIRIRLEGPALNVRKAKSAPRMVPLRTISRVYVRGHAEWQTAALLACADRKIPVLFMNRKGELRGRFYPSKPDRPESDLANNLDQLLHQTDGKELFDQWLAATAQHKAIEQLPRLQFRRAGAHYRPEQLLNGLKVKAKKENKTTVWVWALSNSTQLLRGRVAEALIRYGLAREPFLSAINLEQQITDLARWRILPIINSWVKTRPALSIRENIEPPAAVLEHLVAHLEKNSNTMVQEIDHIIGLLHIWLLEIT